MVDFSPFFSVCSTLTENGTDELIFNCVVPVAGAESYPESDSVFIEGASGMVRRGATGLGMAMRLALRLFFVTWLGSTDMAVP